MIVVSNPRGDQPVPVPTRDDGGRFNFEMIFDGSSRRAYADTYTELVEALIDGYNNVESNAVADELRLLYAVRIQVELQAEICSPHHGKLSDSDRLVLLGDRHTPPQIGMWRSPIPLVLVETYYQPMGDLDRPIGRPQDGSDADSNLIWIDPTDEETLIVSAADAGVITVGETNDA